MIFEDVLKMLEEGDCEILNSYEAWCDFYGDDDEEAFAIDYSTGLWR